MKLQFIITIIVLCLSSCSYKQASEQKSYTIYWLDNNLCVTMPHPTMGIVRIGMEDWGGVELDNVVDDIYNECLQSDKSGNIVVWVRFENPQTDKYGNETMAFNDYEIATIPLSEARKYKSGKYLDWEYKLSEGFHTAAFGRVKDNIPDFFVTPITNPSDTATIGNYYIP